MRPDVSPMRAGMPDRFYLIAALFVAGLAFVLRIWDLAGPSLWFDEIVYALNSSGSLSDTIHQTQTNNSSPIGLPFLLYLLNQAFGLGEGVVRFPSVVAGTGAVIIMLALPRVGVDKRVALGASLLLALGQMQIMYSQEVREYSFSILASAALVWTFLYSIKTGKILPVALAIAVTPWLSYGGCFVILAVLAVYGAGWVLRRPLLPLSKIALLFVVFAVSVAAVYFAFARFQLGLAQQWYLIEHYLGASGMNPVVWLAKNTGGVFLASMPGFLSVLVAPLILGAFVLIRLRRPLEILSYPPVLLAIVLVAGVAVAGAIEIYPYGSPRHSVFFGPVLTLAVSVAFFDLVDRLPVKAARGVIIGAAVFIVMSAGFALAAFMPGGHLNETLQKVAAVRVYGEYENNRALAQWARERQEYKLYSTPGALPGLQYYGQDLTYYAASREVYNNPSLQAEDILREAAGQEMAVVMANIAEDEAILVREELQKRGAQVWEIFEATRVEGFILTP